MAPFEGQSMDEFNTDKSLLRMTTAEGERRIRVHNACIPLTNIRHLPYDYIDPTAIALYYSRMGLSKVQMNAYNFPTVAA